MMRLPSRQNQTARPAVRPTWNCDASVDGPLPEELEPLMGISTSGPSVIPTCSTGESTNMASTLAANWLTVLLEPVGGLLVRESYVIPARGQSQTEEDSGRT